MKHFYLHIPFCRQKCPYCKFALTPIFDEAKKKRYLGYLKREIREYFLSSRRDPFQNQVGEKNIQNLLSEGKRDFSAPLRNDKIETETIYFGGGTPSVLSLEEVASILACFDMPSPLGEGWGEGEITFECNPEDITSEYVSGLFGLGINRLSIGVQSLNDETLKAIHRSNRESILHALESIGSSLLSFRGTRNPFQNHFGEEDTENQLSAGKRDFSAPLRNDKKSSYFLNTESSISINTDFILGLPFAKPGETLENIQELHRRFPFISHTSVYMLEDGLYPKEWKSSSMSEEAIGEEYVQISEYFASLGWHHYEISSWSRSGYECRHNQGYWDHTDYRGFGLSATSYISGRRWENSASFAGYYRGEIASDETISDTELELEKIIFDIRTFSLKDTGFDPEICEKLEREKKILRQDGKILLTSTGIFQENSIIAELISHIHAPKSE